MTADELLSKLEALGVTLSCDGDDLRYRAPVGVMTSELMETIREHRGEIVAILATPPGRSTSPAPARQPSPTTEPFWPAAQADWVLLLQPSDLPPRFVLRQGVEVFDRDRFLASLQRDARLGPDGPRARYGALQGDIRALRQLLVSTTATQGR